MRSGRVFDLAIPMLRPLTVRLLTTLLLLPATAGAAEVRVEPQGTFTQVDRRGTVLVDAFRVVVVAAPGEVNHLEVGPGDGGRVAVRDGATPLAAGAGCRPDGERVLCDVPARPGVAVRLTGTAIVLGDGDDRLVLRSPAFSLLAPTDAVSMGAGADVVRVVGADSHAQVSGGPGPDDVDAVQGAQLRMTYAERLLPVSVTLDGVADDGVPGEGDLVGPAVTEVVGGAGADVLDAAASAVNPAPDGRDGVRLRGGPGEDRLVGSARRDDLEGDDGADVLVGGDGDDGLNGGLGGDVLRGGPGNDLADYAGRTSAVAVQPGTGADDGQAGELDDVGSDVERVRGGSASDDLRGGPGSQELDGGPGDDRLVGGPGNDRLLAADGRDTVDGGPGRDTVLLAEPTALGLRDGVADLLLCRAPPRGPLRLDPTDELAPGCRPSLAVAGTRMAARDGGRVRALVRCARASLPCRAALELRPATGRAVALARRTDVRVPADGRTRTVALRLTSRGRALLRGLPASGRQVRIAVRDVGARAFGPGRPARLLRLR